MSKASAALKRHDCSVTDNLARGDDDEGNAISLVPKPQKATRSYNAGNLGEQLKPLVHLQKC